MESINEEDEVLSSLGGKENPEEAELDRYIEVLQARMNRMALGKKQLDLLKPAPATMYQLNNVPLAEKTYQDTSTKPLPNTPAPSHSHPHPTVQDCGTY